MRFKFGKGCHRTVFFGTGLLTEVRIARISTGAVQEADVPLPGQRGVQIVEHGLVVRQKGHLWACYMLLQWRKPGRFLFLLSAVVLHGAPQTVLRCGVLWFLAS